MKTWHIALVLTWLCAAAAMVYFTGSLRLPTGIMGEVRKRFPSVIEPTKPALSSPSTPSASAASPAPFPPSALEPACSLEVGRLKDQPLGTVETRCLSDQETFYSNGKSTFWGHVGQEHFMDVLFSRTGNRAFFETGQPITVVHVGAHLGQIIDRYAHLRRGARLDDRIYLFEPNPANYERLARRVRLDPRLVLVKKAVSNEEGKRFFEYGSVPNTLGSGGRLNDEPVANASLSTEEGFVVDVTTLDSALSHVPVVDFLLIDPEGWEPRVLMGATKTLARTRFVVFGCSMRWAAHSKLTTNKRLFQLLADAGHTVSVLGKEKHVLASPNVSPDRVFDRLNQYGFCSGVKTTPLPPVGNLTALSLLMTGLPPGTPFRGESSPPCLRYIAGALHKSCKGMPGAAQGAPKAKKEEGGSGTPALRSGA
jgi:FkbM family methyltransferase